MSFLLGLVGLAFALADELHRPLDLVVVDPVLLLQVLQHLPVLRDTALVEVAADLVLLFLEVREVLPDRGLGHRETAGRGPSSMFTCAGASRA